MKIAIDARFLGPEGAGLGKYAENLLEHIQDKDKINEYFVILREANIHLFKPKAPNFKKVLVNAKWYSPKEQILIPLTLRKIKPDLVHFLSYNVPLLWNGNFVVTIYDLTKTEFGVQASNVNNPLLYSIKQAFYKHTIKKVIDDSAKIIAGSDDTKNKLVKIYQAEERKIITIYAGTEKSYLTSKGREISDKERVLNSYNVRKPFLLYVGNAFPYKNLSVVLETLKLIDKRVNLVYVSSRNVFVEKLIEEAKKLGVTDRLIITGYVPNDDLSFFYRSAECFVFPSLSEGFGLPGLEAMTSRCPVVCSNIEVFKEVYGEGALYFDPRSPEDLANKISLVLRNKNLRENLIKKALKRVKKYSWDKTASETLRVYNSLV